MRNQVESAIGMRIAPFVLPLAVTIFVFILISNWLAVLPVQYTDKHGHTTELLKSAAADINYVLALALSCSSATTRPVFGGAVLSDTRSSC